MERMTGFPTGAIAHMQASGQVVPGAHSVENAVNPTILMKALKKRGLIFD
jgi:hypothetical protein